MRIAVLLLVLGWSCFSFAWDFSGFASIGIGKLNRDDLAFMDYDGDWSAESDSVLGVQLTVPLTERAGITTQVVSKGFSYDSKNSFEPELEWMFASYQIGSSLRARVGRLRAPHYFFSETLDVGYTYPWARPPVDVYAFLLEPFSSLDGADLQAHFSFGDAEMETQLFAGSMEGNFRDNEVDVPLIWGGNAKLFVGSIAARYAYSRIRADIFNPAAQPLIDALNGLAMQLSDPLYQRMAEQLVLDDAQSDYHAIGAQWDLGAWTVLYEHYALNPPAEGYANKSLGWYVSLVYQYERVSPYLVLGGYRNWYNGRISEFVEQSYASVPEGSSPEIDQVRAQLMGVVDQFRVEERTFTTGVRWDYADNMALKLEVEYFRFYQQSTGHLFPDDLDNKPEDAVATTIVWDLVF